MLPDGSQLLTTYFCPCPEGHYCPNGTASPLPCPVGTFGPWPMQYEEPVACLPCRNDTFNDLLGQGSCFPCGSSAFALSGASECTCMGANRHWSRTDGRCICNPGFVFYNEKNEEDSETDHAEACQPATEARCKPSQLRLASRECIDPGDTTAVATHCASQCGGEEYVQGLSVELGTCECTRYASVDEVCNSTCQSTVPKLVCGPSVDGRQTFILTLGTDTLREYVECPGLQGRCSEGSNTLPVSFGEQTDDASPAISGDFPDVEYYDELCTNSTSTVRQRRRRRSAEPAFGLAGISNPLICITAGSSVTFKLNPLNRSSYPEYFKDHLLSTDDGSFDAGAFRNLADVLTQTNLSVSFFTHEFTLSGLFVFRDHASPSLLMFIRVMPLGVACPAGSVQPATTSALIFAGAEKAAVTQEPDWALISAVLTLSGVITLVLTVVALLWRPHRWSRPDTHGAAVPGGLRNWSLRSIMPWGSSPAGGSGSGSGGKGTSELQDFNVATFFDKLDDQSKAVATQLLQHSADAQKLYDRLVAQTDALRTLLLQQQKDQQQQKQLTGAGADVGAAASGSAEAAGADGAAEQTLQQQSQAQSQAQTQSQRVLSPKEEALMQTVQTLLAGLVGHGRGSAGDGTGLLSRDRLQAAAALAVSDASVAATAAAALAAGGVAGGAAAAADSISVSGSKHKLTRSNSKHGGSRKGKLGKGGRSRRPGSRRESTAEGIEFGLGGPGSGSGSNAAALPQLAADELAQLEDMSQMVDLARSMATEEQARRLLNRWTANVSDDQAAQLMQEYVGQLSKTEDQLQAERQAAIKALQAKV